MSRRAGHRMFSRSSGKVGFHKYQHHTSHSKPYDRDAKLDASDMMMFHRTSGKDGHKTFLETMKKQTKTTEANKQSPDAGGDVKAETRDVTDETDKGATKSEVKTQERQGASNDDEQIRIFPPPVPRMFHMMSGKTDFKPYSPVRMSHWTSGKTSFKHYTDKKLPESGDFVKDRNLVIEMLKMEQKLRLSKETQEEYDRQSRGESRIPPCTIEDNIQRRVLKSHGIEPSEDNLSLYRCINGLYPDDNEVRQLVVYMKYDRSKMGDLRPGMMWPDVTFNTVNLQTCNLSDIYKDQTQPLVLIAASIS